MRFTKIKWNGEKVELRWTTHSGETLDTIEHKLVSYDPPEPEMEEAFAAFVSPVLDILELPEMYGKDLRVTGASVNWGGESDRMGVVLTCLKDLAETNAPLVLNTPHLKEEDPEDGNAGQMPQKMVRMVDELQSRAARYVNGHRAQGELFEAA